MENRITPNFGFGAYYSRDRFYAGMSVPNVIQNRYSESNQEGTTLIGHQQRHYFFIAGAVFNLGRDLAFKPTTLVKLTAAAPAQADITATFILMKKLHLGAIYRTGDAFGALVGLSLTDQFYLGYSFDKSHGLNTFRYNNGSHEIVLRYDFIFSGKKQIHSPRHF
jgi:type IX secretion system PorP/SprF family membrane protein